MIGATQQEKEQFERARSTITSTRLDIRELQEAARARSAKLLEVKANSIVEEPATFRVFIRWLMGWST